MSTGKIIAIIVGAVLLLCVVVAGGMYYWIKTSGPQLMAQGEVVRAEAVEFGKSTDNQGCLAESLTRYDQCGGDLTCHVMVNVYLLGCLEASEPTPGFCDGVPDPGSFMDSVGWRLQQCEKYGRGGAPCGNLFGQIEEYCKGRN